MGIFKKIDNSDLSEEQRVIIEIISKEDLWELHNFFELCNKRYSFSINYDNPYEFSTTLSKEIVNSNLSERISEYLGLIKYLIHNNLLFIIKNDNDNRNPGDIAISDCGSNLLNSANKNLLQWLISNQRNITYCCSPALKAFISKDFLLGPDVKFRKQINTTKGIAIFSIIISIVLAFFNMCQDNPKPEINVYPAVYEHEIETFDIDSTIIRID